MEATLVLPSPPTPSYPGIRKRFYSVTASMRLLLLLLHWLFHGLQTQGDERSHAAGILLYLLSTEWKKSSAILALQHHVNMVHGGVEGMSFSSLAITSHSSPAARRVADSTRERQSRRKQLHNCSAHAFEAEQLLLGQEYKALARVPKHARLACRSAAFHGQQALGRDATLAFRSAN